MKAIFRFFKIITIFYQFALIDILNTAVPKRFRIVLKLLPKSRKYRQFSAPTRLRMALEELGPIYIKFGQVLSTRPDIFPKEYIIELSKLQDNVIPFDGEIAKIQIEKDFKCQLADLFYDFELTPVASASIAQVHRAYLKDKNGNKGDKVAVKVIRPNIKVAIAKDLALLTTVCRLLEKFFLDARRLKLQSVLEEFKKYLHDEINLMNEAANGSLLRRQFPNSHMLIVPKIYFDYSSKNVMTMEWMDGTPISDIETLKKKNINLKQLSAFGVEIFFTQVFNNGFFHADMHPGNILVADDGRYIALDFGIVGSLTDFDKRYLAINFLAFFNRDYYRVAEAHIESGWAPPNTRIEELEAAIRSVCEGIFNQPLSRISFGLVLLRLFETSRRFNIEVQPQLVLLQKTLLNVEGLGRQLDPDLDLWDIGRPFFVDWTKRQFGLEAFWGNLKKEAPNWALILPQLPRKLYESLNRPPEVQNLDLLKLIKTQQGISRWLMMLTIGLFILIVIIMLQYFK